MLSVTERPYNKNFSRRLRRLFQPSLCRSRDSSLGNCSCLNRNSVPPSRSKSSTVTTLLWFSHSSSSSHCHVNTIFFPGTSSRYSPNTDQSSSSCVIRSQRYLPPTCASAAIARPHVFWTKPFFQLRRISPRSVNASGRRIDKPCDLERCLLCGFLVHDFPFALSTNCFSSEPIIAVQPASKFFRAYAGVFGNVSIPLCVSFSRVLSYHQGIIQKLPANRPARLYIARCRRFSFEESLR